MILIIMHHYSVHGGFLLNDNVISINKIIVQFLLSGGKLGVDCFILITGYFMIKSTFKFDKFLKLIFTIFSYSVLIYATSLIAGYINFLPRKAIESFFPVIFDQYWFATSYILLYIFSPYINSLIYSLDKRNHFRLIILLIAIWSILPTLTLINLNFSSIEWFATLYVIAAYIRLYPNSWFDNLKINRALFLMSYFLILLSIIIFDFIGIKIYLFSKHSTYLTGMNMLPLLFCSITFLLWFKNININYNRYINIISSSMFGVYLIHDNNIVRYLLWKDIFKNNSYFDSKYLLLHSISSVLLVFLCCILIDQFKKLILEKPLSRKIEVFSIYFLGKLQNFNIKLYNLVNRTFG